MSTAQKEAKRQIENKRLRRKHLGTVPLKTRLKRFLKGSHNLSRTPKRLAVEKERTKLARLMEERQKNGEATRTKLRAARHRIETARKKKQK